MKKTHSAKKVIIVGAGIGGLATAALLARQGYDVSVFDKNEQPGGRASQLKKKGFTFDMGPSWYLMPDVFDRFFSLFGYQTKDLLHLTRFLPQYRVFFDDTTIIDITGNLKKDADTFEKIEPGSAQQLKRYLSLSKEKYDLAIKGFLYKNFNYWWQMITPDIMKFGPKLDVFMSMDAYVKQFFTSQKLQQIIQYTLVFLGGSPKNTPALYSLMSHIDFNLGVWYPRGGMYEIVKALVKLGTQHGVTYHFNSPVTEIVTQDNPSQNWKEKLLGVSARKVMGIKVKTTFFPADVVVSNADYAFSESILTNQSDAEYGSAYWQKTTMAPSAFLLYLGIKGKLPKLIHHNLYFGQDWTKHFDEIFQKPDWPLEPSIYLNKTSFIDKTVAPKGHETLFVLVPVASGLAETPESKEKYANYIISFIEKKLDITLRDKIVLKEIFSLTEFAERYNSYKGTALGLAHTLFQTAIWRPRNHSRKVPNLFFVGGNTVPGVGVPICLISAQLVAEQVAKLDEVPPTG